MTTDHIALLHRSIVFIVWYDCSVVDTQKTINCIPYHKNNTYPISLRYGWNAQRRAITFTSKPPNHLLVNWNRTISSAWFIINSDCDHLHHFVAFPLHLHSTICQHGWIVLIIFGDTRCIFRLLWRYRAFTVTNDLYRTHGCWRSNINGFGDTKWLTAGLGRMGVMMMKIMCQRWRPRRR